MATSRAAFLLVLPLVNGAAGCGDDGSASDGATSSSSASAGVTVTTGGTATSSATSSTGMPSTPIPCTSEGGLYCGGNGIDGDPNVLYVCQDGFFEVLQDCGAPCQAMPMGIPDQCPSSVAVPASLIDTIDATPYVEQNCVPTTYEGWPYAAQECTYTTGGITTTVKVANPPPDRVGAWIVDAASFIPALAALAGVDQAAYEDGLSAIGLAMMYQSSRIYPLSGGIIENLGGGYEIYDFEKGVTATCSTGCYCRINSLHRTEWCSYRASLGDDYDACIAQVGSSGLTAGWGNQCFQNHVDAWTADSNEHFRAKAYMVNLTVADVCPPDACSPSEVVSVLEGALGL